MFSIFNHDRVDTFGEVPFIFAIVVMKLKCLLMTVNHTLFL